MTAWRLFHDLRRRGVRIRIDAGRLLVEPVSALTASDRASLQAHRDEVMSLVDWEQLGHRYVDALRAGADLPPLTSLSREKVRRLIEDWDAGTGRAEARRDENAEGGRP